MRTDGRALLGFFGLTYLLSWLIWVPVMTASFGWPGFGFPPAGLVGALMPGIAAMVVAGALGGRGALKALLRQALVWRAGVRWYAAALLLVPAIVACSYLIGSLMRGSWLPAPEASLGAIAIMVLLQTPNTLLEEIGWRGFALPKLASRFGWLAGSLILGVIWAAWHLPYWISAPNVHLYGPLSVVLFFAVPVSGSVFLAWIYRDTRSVLLTWIAHLSINVTIAFLPLASEDIGNLWPQAFYTGFMVLLAVAAGIKLAQLRTTAGKRIAGQSPSALPNV